MRCTLVRSLSSQYLEGSLEERQMSAIRGHLRECDECAHALDDEARLIRAAESLGPVDPPASLWASIATEMAAREVEDSHRSAAWFWWRGAWSRYRLHLGGATLAAAVVALMLWRPGFRVETPVAGTEATAEAQAPAGPQRTFEDARGHEIARADARYLGAIDELATEVERLQPEWSADRRRAFEARMAAFAIEVEKHRQAGLLDGDVLGRDELYAVYRQEIDFLSEVAMGEPLP